MRLDIRFKAEVNALHSKIEALEERIDKLEGKNELKKPKTHREKKE